MTNSTVELLKLFPSLPIFFPVPVSCRALRRRRCENLEVNAQIPVMFPARRTAN